MRLTRNQLNRERELVVVSKSRHCSLLIPLFLSGIKGHSAPIIGMQCGM